MKRVWIGITIILLYAIVVAGCSQPPGASPSPTPITPSVQPGSTPQPANASPNVTMVTPSMILPRTPSPAGTITGNAPAWYDRFTGPDYAIDYPAGWNSSAGRRPLPQYSYSGAGCMVTAAYELDQEQRTWTSPDGKSVLIASIVSTQRDIWPRGFNGQIVYADIVNSYFGNPARCANTPEGTISMTGLEDISVAGVPFRGSRYDFGMINATGFTQGTGSCIIVTGLNTRGIFALYRSGTDPIGGDTVSQRIFNSIWLNSRF